MKNTGGSDPIQIAPTASIAGGGASAIDFTLDTLTAKRLAECLSAPRMEQFLRRTDNDHLLALQLYEWNVDLASSLYFPLHIFEVSIRNAIAGIVQDKWPEWWSNPTFYAMTPTLTAYVAEAREKASENRGGFPIRGPDVIAATTLKMWRELCKSHYWLHLWKKGQTKAFPHRKERDNTVDIHKIIDNALKLRNRIAHQEHILGSLRDAPGKKLEERYGEILMAIEWVNPTAALWVAAKSAFSQVYLRHPLR